MKQRHLYLLLLILLGVAGLMAGIGLSQDTLSEIQRIGDIRPTGVQYDPNNHQFVWVDPQGRLILADASTYTINYTLYESGLYNAYKFSHDGDFLALAIDTRVELWDAQTGTKITEINPDGALRTEGPLFFSDDDELLSFNTQVRAPRELRRSENDTVNLPWVWDYSATARIRTSILPNGVTAQPFFDLRNGFLMGSNNYTIVGLPQRLRLMQITSQGFPMITDIPANRNEPDPVTLWFNQDESMIYVSPNGGTLTQIDTASGNLYEIPLGSSFSFSRGNDSPTAFPALENLKRPVYSQLIGDPNSTLPNTLLRTLLGENYVTDYGFHPLTVYLIDFLKPQTAQAGREGILIYIYDDTNTSGTLRFIQPEIANQYLLHPDGNHLLNRRLDGRVEVYDIRTGGIVSSFFELPSDRHDVFAFDKTGDIYISDFQQFNVWTGEKLYQNFDYYVNTGDILFSFDNEQLITITGNDWWVWDINTGEVIQEEQVDYRGNYRSRTADTHRYLSEVNSPQGLQGMEVYDVRTGERRTVYFENLQDRFIESVIESPDWEHFIVVYSRFQYDPYQPNGNIISLYSLDEGKLWLLAGDDLPYTGARRYGWTDNKTAYIYGERNSPEQPERIYGLDYHVTGLPQCMVDAFPNDYGRWLGIWERLSTSLRSDELGHLTIRLCDALPGNVEVVENIFHPSPTPTRAPITATPSSIAGVPQCLTSRFPRQAREYAEDWRKLTEGLTPEEIEEQEKFLCAGLTGSDSTSGANVTIRDSNIQVMLIDIESGRRSVGGFIPQAPFTNPRNVQLVLDDLRIRGVGPFDTGVISPDGTLFAAKDRFGHVVIYRLPRIYQDLAADATATESIFVGGNARVLSLPPTATQGFNMLGEARPTLTPTITPTSPPRTDEIYELSNRDEVEELCPVDHLYNITEPPADYAASGRIWININQNRGQSNWILEPQTGKIYLDDALQNCTNDCGFSPDLNWVIRNDNEGISVSHPDGSNKIVIYENLPGDYRQPQNLRWVQDEPHLLRYSFSEYVSGEKDPVTFFWELQPETGEITQIEPVEYPDFEFDGANYNQIQQQPGTENRYSVLRTSFNTGRNIGAKYYIYDYETTESIYFARLAEDEFNNEMDFRWSEFGDLLFYHYPQDTGEWYVFDTTSREFSFYGDLPDGNWSRDYRYRISNYTLPEPEYSQRVENEEELPKIQVWDSQTDLTRLYCVPGTEQDSISSSFMWSPDNRYVVFRQMLAADRLYEGAPTRTLILDTQSGTVTEVSQEPTGFVMWTD